MFFIFYFWKTHQKSRIFQWFLSSRGQVIYRTSSWKLGKFLNLIDFLFNVQKWTSSNQLFVLTTSMFPPWNGCISLTRTEWKKCVSNWLIWFQPNLMTNADFWKPIIKNYQSPSWFDFMSIKQLSEENTRLTWLKYEILLVVWWLLCTTFGRSLRKVNFRKLKTDIRSFTQHNNNILFICIYFWTHLIGWLIDLFIYFPCF